MSNFVSKCLLRAVEGADGDHKLLVNGRGRYIAPISRYPTAEYITDREFFDTFEKGKGKLVYQDGGDSKLLLIIYKGKPVVILRGNSIRN